jgi:DNA-binding GntR family transcriptional regulator
VPGVRRSDLPAGRIRLERRGLPPLPRPRRLERLTADDASDCVLRSPSEGVIRRQTTSRVETLEDELERLVLDGRFKPGEHLGEIALAEEFDVGRNTLRAAFDGLVRRGLLVKSRNRGVFVRALTAHDLGEIYEVRVALEVQAARILAARKHVPDSARAALAQHHRLGPRSSQRVVVEADLAFHRALVVATGNARLTRAHKQLEIEILLCLAQLVRGYATVGQLAGEHGSLLEAIESGRPDTAESVIRGHLENATTWLVAHAAPMVDDGYAVGLGALSASSDRG